MLHLSSATFCVVGVRDCGCSDRTALKLRQGASPSAPQQQHRPQRGRVFDELRQVSDWFLAQNSRQARSMSSSQQVTDEPVAQLRGLQEAFASVRCHPSSRALYAGCSAHLAALLPVLADSIRAMREAAAFGQTLKQAQLKELRVSVQQQQELCVCGRACIA